MNDLGLNCNLLSVDGIHDPEVLSINGASAALRDIFIIIIIINNIQYQY